MARDDEKHMARALELAARGRGRTSPNPMVGCVIVRDGVVLGEGWHERAGEPHAEVNAVRACPGGDIAGATVYVTLEPCAHEGKTPPCAPFLAALRPARVVAAMRDPNPLVAGRGLALLREAGIAVEAGLLEAEARRLNEMFLTFITTGLPFVVAKCAMTLDGKIATADGDSRWISNEESRAWVHRLRDKVDAVMVGAGTVSRDNPQLTTRLPEGGRDAARIVVDCLLDIPEEAQILDLKSAAPTLVATSEETPGAKVKRLADRGVEVLRIPPDEDGIDLRQLLKILGKRGFQSLLLEGGSRLNGAMWRHRLIDRVMVCIAPKLLGGGDGLSLFSGRGVQTMAEAVFLEDVRVAPFGDNVLIEGDVPCLPD